MQLLELIAFVFIVNIPFGYWRGNTQKLSKQWFLAVHVPVFITIIARVLVGIGFSWESLPFLVAAFFLGQLTGKQLRSILGRHIDVHLSSCLVMDVARRLRAG